MTRTKAPLEKELKYFLKKQEYEKLIRISHKKIIGRVKQTNFYFDDSSLRLRRNKIGLRIRFEDDGGCTLTLKEPSKLKSTKVPKLKVRHEWESPLTPQLGRELVSGTVALSTLKKKPITILRKRISLDTMNRIKNLGAIKTNRTFIRAEKNTILEVDKYKIFQKRFYELEVETQKPEVADQVVRALLSRH